MYNKNTANPQARIVDQPEYKKYYGMRQRCYDKNATQYSYYGGRGIKVCQRWTEPKGHGFWNFLKDMGRQPDRFYTIERINNNGNYEPSNCRWASRKQQARNRRVRHDNKVGITGVNYDKTNKRWVARRTGLDGKRHLIGYFKTAETAGLAVQKFGLL